MQFLYMCPHMWLCMCSLLLMPGTVCSIYVCVLIWIDMCPLLLYLCMPPHFAIHVFSVLMRHDLYAYQIAGARAGGFC